MKPTCPRCHHDDVITPAAGDSMCNTCGHEWNHDRPGLPPRRTARDLDFHSHDYVCPACVHRQHDVCDLGCRFCGSECQCVCRRWAIPVKAT